MKNFSTKLLQATALSAVLSLGAYSSEALAFDTVNWDWQKLVDETVVKNTTVNVDVNPSGELEMEKLQVQIGDVSSNSTVTGVHNNQPAGQGDGSFTGIISLDVDYQNIAEGNNAPVNATLAGGGDISTVEWHDGNEPVGTFNAGTGVFSDNIEVAVSGTVDVSGDAVGDAVDLPSVSSVATAVGNNQSIDSSVSLQLHDAQFLFGGFAQDQTAGRDIPAVDSGNTHTAIAAGLTMGGALGIITPANISANSTVSDILNASVDSSATAVGNNMDITLAAYTPDDALVIADITQYGYANVNATSSVSDVNINNYANLSGANMGPLGDPQIPLVNSTATAVGNNFAIKVSSPAIP
jgi:hypothetical protein